MCKTLKNNYPIFSGSRFRQETCPSEIGINNLDYKKMNANRVQVLRLYKSFLNYSKELKHTDKDYFLTRIKKEFVKNKNLVKEEEIAYCIKQGKVFLVAGRVL